MEPAELTGIKEHINRLIHQTEDEIHYERAERTALLKSDENLNISRLLVIDLLLLNILLFFVLDNYMIDWITASFLLYAVNPFIMLIPSTQSIGPRRRKGTRDYLATLRQIELYKNKWTLGKILWNAFFINSQPLAIGFSLVYCVNIIFTLTYGLGPITDLVTFQSIAIIIFYLGIWYLKPYSADFLDSLLDIRTDIYQRIHTRMQPLWTVILSIGTLATLVIIVTIAAMMLPGFTLNAVLDAKAAIKGLGVIPVLMVMISQILLVRFSQGAHSRRMIINLKDRKTEVLNNFVDIPLIVYRSKLEKGQIDAVNSFARDFSDIRDAYISSKVYKTTSQDLFGFFPVYLMVPDPDVILNPAIVRILHEQVDLKRRTQV
ncbi:hypothetical protein [Methanosphaerula palustris]|uniref:Uncharacterized protein n=1 Tax=Methanosphaerula palustris (strain ATCC BAA-1556 / DSM 19958 / E1-9c) TaxID=521011 RepID=B8GKK6_METPE|nr:hypothetical protein [Methanosphaerula palustris]ACL15889.1 hypothetical protein Mpal_0516 [Methanosphaerula palustris E1-9c]